MNDLLAQKVVGMNLRLFTLLLGCLVFMDRLVLSWQSPVIMNITNFNTQYGMLGFATNICYVFLPYFCNFIR